MDDFEAQGLKIGRKVVADGSSEVLPLGIDESAIYRVVVKRGLPRDQTHENGDGAYFGLGNVFSGEVLPYLYTCTAFEKCGMGRYLGNMMLKILKTEIF
jgi:hypothetical protein